MNDPNLQGSVKCFDLLTGEVVVLWTIKVLPMPDSILKLINHWGKLSRSQQYGTKLESLDRNKANFDWDNDDLEENEGLVESNPTTHPGILAEIPGVAIESDSAVDTSAIEEVPVPDRAARAAAARANANFAMSPGVLENKIRGVR